MTVESSLGIRCGALVLATVMGGLAGCAPESSAYDGQRTFDSPDAAVEALLAAARDGGNRKVRGTSFAAPHVAGAVALLLEGTPTLDPAAIKSHLLSNATTGVVKEAGADSPDRLLYVR